MTEAVPRMGLSDGAGPLTYHVPISGDTKLCKVKIGNDIHPVDAVLWTRKRLLIGNFHKNFWVTLIKGKHLAKVLEPIENTPPTFSIEQRKADQLVLHVKEIGKIRITCAMEGHPADIHFKDKNKTTLNFYPKIDENLKELKGVTLHMFDK